MLGDITQRDIRRYYPKRYWEILPKEILGDTTQRDIGRYYPKRYFHELLVQRFAAIVGYREKMWEMSIDVEELGCEVSRLGVAKKCCLGLVVPQAVEELGCEVARLGVAKKCCLGLVVPRVEEETKRRMWSLGDQVGSLSTL
ncbi:hypothetical protein Tco_1220964 [Tanacetum coccineum]